VNVKGLQSFKDQSAQQRKVLPPKRKKRLQTSCQQFQPHFLLHSNVTMWQICTRRPIGSSWTTSTLTQPKTLRL